MIRATNVKRGQISAEGLIRIKREAIPETRNAFLKEGDIVVVRSGAYTGDVAMITKGWAGSVAGYDLVVSLREQVDPAFCSFYLLGDGVQAYFRTQRARAAQSHLNRHQLESTEIPLPSLSEQRKIAGVLGVVQRAMEQQERLLALTAELKKALLHQLFTAGLRGEPQKQTKIGPMPTSWTPTPLGTCCDILSGSLSYTDFLKMAPSIDDDVIECMGVKVSDMNLSGNESRLATANLAKRLPLALAQRKLIPPNTVVFPKRGAAIATNKKRLTTTWTVLDPNLIGLRTKDSLDAEFLFHWSQTFDLRKITDPGPTPQLNKKDLVPVLIPLPSNFDEQRGIAAVISCVDSKLRCHQRKHTTLTDLFRTLLNQLMTAQLRVYDLDLPGLEVADEE